MRSAFKLASLLFSISVICTLNSCKKHVKDNDSGSINSPIVSSNIWQSGTYITDATVFSTFNNINKATIVFGDENITNWTLAPRGVTAAPANWELEMRSVINAVNRGVAGATYLNSINLIDSLARYRTISGAIYVMLGTNDLYSYGTGVGNIWNTTSFKTHFKNFMWKLMRTFNGQNIYIPEIPSNSYATPWVGSGGITQLNDSIRSWCDSAVNDRIRFVYASPSYMQPSGKYISYASTANGYSTTYASNFRSSFVMGNIHTPISPIAKVNNSGNGGSVPVCRSVNRQFTLTANKSVDPDGTITTYQWVSLSPDYTVLNPNSISTVVQKNSPWGIPSFSPAIRLLVTDNEFYSNYADVVILGINCP